MFVVSFNCSAIAEDKLSTGDTKGAKRLEWASLFVAVAGILTALAVYAVIVVVVVDPGPVQIQLDSVTL